MGSDSKCLSPSSSWSPAIKKIIKNLKEVVDSKEQEIYAVLVECDMNPDEAVQRLLSQDTFHEVRSKRERRKEMKETQESRPRVNNGSSARGSRGASEQSTGWNESLQQSSEENGNYAPSHKGVNLPAPSLPVPHLASHVERESLSQQPHRSSSHTDSRGLVVAEASSAWPVTSTENPSMADIVRMGRFPTRGSQMSSEPYSHTHQKEANVSGTTESDNAVLQNSCLDEQTVAEQWTETGPDDSAVSDADKHSNSEGPNFSENRDGNFDDEQKGGSNPESASHSDHSEPDSVSNSSDPGHPAALSNDVGAKMEQLNKGDEEENDCGIILPSHLQALAADCSHLNLSFGTFRLGNTSTSTSEVPSDQSKDTQENSTTVVASSMNAGHASMEEPLESLYGTRRDGLNYNLSEEAKKGVSDEPFGSDYIRPALHDSIDGHSSSQLSFARTDPVVENQSIKSQPSTYVEYECQPSDELMSTLQALRVSESLQSQFLASQSMPTRHANTSSSFSSASIPFSEAIQDRQSVGRGAFSVADYNNQHRIPNTSKHLFEQPGNNPYSTLSQSSPQFASAFQHQHQQQHPVRGLQGANRFPGAYGYSSNPLGNYSPYSSPPSMVANRGLSSFGGGGYQPRYSNPEKHLYSSLQQQNSSSSTWNQGSVYRPQAYAEELSARYNLLGSQQQQGNRLPLQYQVGSGYSGVRQQSQVDASRDHQRHQQPQRFGGSGVDGARSDLLSRRNANWFL